MSLSPDGAPPFRLALLHPRCWPSWCAIGAMRLLMWLPIRLQLLIGATLGRTLGHLAQRRRTVVLENLAVCLPELDEAGRERLANQHFAAMGRALFETALAWFAEDRRLLDRFKVTGREHLEAALADGRGILLLTGHFTHLEIGARIVCSVAGLPFHALYRPYDNPLFDYFMHRWRQRRSGLPSLPRDDLRGLVRALREGRAVWYAPDQTLDPRISVFAPFFGVAAATVTGTARLARLGRAQVLPYFPYVEDEHWCIRFLPVIENFPGGDDVADASRINQLIEQGARGALPQYFWSHRRFKHRPADALPIYSQRKRRH